MEARQEWICTGCLNAVQDCACDPVSVVPCVDPVVKGSDHIVTNAKGGKGSKIYGKMSEVPPLALLEVAKVMAEGAERYPREADGTPNWHKVGCIENLDHGMEHVANFIAARNCYAEQVVPDELSHAACRILMALEQLIRGEM